MNKQVNTENGKEILIKVPPQTESKNMNEAAIGFADVIRQFHSQTDDMSNEERTLAMGKAMSFLLKKQQPKLTDKKLNNIFKKSLAIVLAHERAITSVKG